MANCTDCGAVVADGGAFCGICGQPVKFQAAPAAATSRPGGAAFNVVAVNQTSSGSSSAESGLTMNLAAALSYALGLITGIVFLVLAPYKHDKFVRFHAMQSVIFSVAILAISIVWSILVGFLVDLAGFWVLAVDLPLRLVFGFAVFFFWLYLMFQAYSKREYRIPFLGPFAAKQAR